MVLTTLGNLPTKPLYNVLDPAVGPGTFPTAFQQELHHTTGKIQFSVYDTDTRMCEYTKSVCSSYDFTLNIHNEDYLLSDVTETFDAVIMNPPYIRHERISSELKRIYYAKIEESLGEKVDRRSNLFVLFLLKSILLLNPDGILCAIVYDSIMNSRYGTSAMRLLDNFAEVLSNDEVKAPFGDAIIDARIICWRKKNKTAQPALSPQHTSTHPSAIVPLETLLKIARGTALPYRKIFIAKPEDQYFSQAHPIVIKQRNPDLLTCVDYDRAYLVAKPKIRAWLQDRLAEQSLSARSTFIKPITGPLCFNYYLRNRPRHILNLLGYAISDNYYVSFPLDEFPVKAAWILLNSDLFLIPILAKARNQGHGLKKLQAYEYRSALVPNWRRLSVKKIETLIKAADGFIEKPTTYNDFRSMATKLATEVFDD